ncbi:hypothetical protein F5144DRAFT_200291 [Chaetomium tenue]|uniref:Uncharacterized protein n=1 Tax=Chaetomium tenue TaxID=1854479 RepID=A0ACB7PIP8_9PEZI|nr:hypothetical protein F5144DRAFT_200291 [Chaetomium globosum]
MPSRTLKQSTQNDMSSRGWACCKCLYLNSGGRHVCQGALPLEGVYDEACNHWHCPSCRGAGNAPPSHTEDLHPTATKHLPFANPYRPSGPSEPPPQFEPHSHSRSHSHSSHSHSHPHSHPPHAHTHSNPRYPPQRPSNPRPLSQPHYHPQPHSHSHSHSPPHANTHPPPSHQQQQQTPHHHHHHHHAPFAPFSHTTAYLQSAARPSTITFAEVFPAPVSLPCVEPVLALAGLRLDYSVGRGGVGGFEGVEGIGEGGDRDGCFGEGWGEGADGGAEGDGDGDGERDGDGGEDGGGVGGGLYWGGGGSANGDGGGYCGGNNHGCGQDGNRDTEGGWWHETQDGEKGKGREQERGGEREKESVGGRNEKKRKAEKEKGKNGGMCKKLDKGKGKGREIVGRKVKGKEKETRRCPGVTSVRYPAGYQPASVEDVFDAGREDGYEYDHGYGRWDEMEREW